MRRRILLSAIPFAAGLVALAAPMAFAATQAPYTDAAFAAAQSAGKPVLIEIDASWCPVCAKQRPILAQLMTDPALAKLVIYKVDFDSQKDVVRAMGANMQSTLIVFHGKTEKGRSTGETNPDAIKALLLKSNA